MSPLDFIKIEEHLVSKDVKSQFYPGWWIKLRDTKWGQLIPTYLAIFFLWWDMRFGDWDDNYYKMVFTHNLWDRLTGKKDIPKGFWKKGKS